MRKVLEIRNESFSFLLSQEERMCGKISRNYHVTSRVRESIFVEGKTDYRWVDKEDKKSHVWVENIAIGKFPSIVFQNKLKVLKASQLLKRDFSKM